MEAKLVDKRWKKEFEEPIYSEWKRTEVYKFDTTSDKPIFSIDTPPPYLNSPIHIGHATTYVLMDMFARYKRMKGYNVLFPLGLDKNGLPIEMAAEKKFNIKFNKMPREDFLKKCKEVLDNSGNETVNSFLRLGIGFNSWKIGTDIGDVYETDSPDYRSLTQDTFIDLWNKDKIYEEERINTYCPGCQTTIADAEIDYLDLPAHFNDIIFKVKETGEDIIIGTTRPELIASCGAVIFHPDDERYKQLEGKTAISPLYNREIKIFSHPFAAIDKGTGLVMMCSAGDTTDIRFFREQGLKPVISINQDGTMNENAEFLKGLRVKEARGKIVEDLKDKKLLIKQVETTHRTPICDRSGDHVEFIAMKEFYLRQLDVKDEMLKIAKKPKFFAESSRKMLTDWIDNISTDWPISRRRYYATEIPLWYCKKCNRTIVPPKGKYYQPWKDAPPVEKCECGSTEFRGEERVLDTWFDSSNSPLYILKYGRNNSFFDKAKPCSLRPQGKDIVRTWLYYTLLKDYLLTGDAIFSDVWINYYVVDEKGKKMSKRKGNVINPQDIINKYGAEPFRLWAAVEGNITSSDFRCSEERIEGAGKTIIKMWNVARFLSMFGKPKSKGALTDLDYWILSEAGKLIKVASEGYENYDFHKPATALRHFIWETFASHYLELVKSRAYNQDGKYTNSEQEAALYTLNRVLDVVLKLMAPITPMVTYKIYKELHNKDIHQESFPEPLEVESNIITEHLVEVNSTIWKAKQDAGISLKSDVTEVTIPEKLESIAKDLQSTHHIKELKFGHSVKVKL